MSDVETGTFEGISHDIPEFFVPEGVKQREIHIVGGNLISVGEKILELTGLQVVYFEYLLDNVRVSPDFHGLPVHPEIANNARTQINTAAEHEAVSARNIPRRPMAHYLSVGTVVVDRRERDSAWEMPAAEGNEIPVDKEKAVETKGVAKRPEPGREYGSRKPKRDGDRSRGKGGLREMIVAHVHTTESDGKNWQERGACLNVDPELFFPERGASTREAKSVCAHCEVKAECLEYALVNGEKFGIWGGLSERERRRLRRQRAVARRAAAEV